jgi:Mg2+ and Co2+ transporter CorA
MISRSLVSSHLSPSTLSEQHKQRSSLSTQKGDTMDYSVGMCEMVYRFAIEEVISSYDPVIGTINTQLEQIEDYVRKTHKVTTVRCTYDSKKTKFSRK